MNIYLLHTLFQTLLFLLKLFETTQTFQYFLLTQKYFFSENDKSNNFKSQRHTGELLVAPL